MLHGRPGLVGERSRLAPASRVEVGMHPILRSIEASIVLALTVEMIATRGRLESPTDITVVGTIFLAAWQRFVNLNRTVGHPVRGVVELVVRVTAIFTKVCISAAVTLDTGSAHPTIAFLNGRSNIPR